MTGSLQIKGGKYYALVNMKDEAGNRKVKWISSGLDAKGNKKNAEKFLRDTLSNLERGGKTIDSKIKLIDYIDQWLELAKIELQDSTYQSYLYVYDKHIFPYFSKRRFRLCDISRDDIQEYVNYLSKYGGKKSQGLSAKTIKRSMVILNQTFTEAIKSNLITNNPCEYIKLPKATKYEASYYNAGQVKTLLNCIKNEPLYDLIYFTIYFGLRRSEVLGIKWDSVDFINRTLTIKHTVVRIETIIEKDTTKNSASHRTYPLNDYTIELLEKRKQTEQENSILFGEQYTRNDYVFKWEDGRPYTPEYVSSKFRKLLKSNDLPIIRFHDLRHSCASLLISEGSTLKDIQEWLGHADIQTTANIYAHLDIERKNLIGQTMSNLIKL